MTTIGTVRFGDMFAPVLAAAELATALDRLDRDPSVHRIRATYSIALHPRAIRWTRR